MEVLTGNQIREAFIKNIARRRCFMDKVIHYCWFGGNPLPELAEKFRMVAAIEKHHEERYRALLKNIEMAEVFAKSEVKVWECRNCGHIVVGTNAPEVCPVCAHPQAYFEIKAENY